MTPRLSTAPKGTITGKGVINNKLTNYLMQVLEREGIPPIL